MFHDQNALKLAHQYLQQHLQEGDVCVDATAGRGKDTAFLCKLVGTSGRVYAFDIQQQAIDSTRELLEQQGLIDRAELFCECHSKLADRVQRAKCVVFNFGYLPGGDHNLFTHSQTSIAAIEAAMSILVDDGFITLCIYYGGDSGFEERDGLLEYLATIPSDRYTVMLQQFYNRPNCPPMLAIIERNR